MSIKNKLNSYSTIIWDWNGTILNDVALCVDIVNKLLLNHNDQRLNKAKYKEVFGFPIINYYQKLGIDLNKESFEILTDKFISNYNSNVQQCNLHDKATDVLNKFKQNKLNQFILTAAHKENVIKLLDHYSLKDFFTEIEGLDNYRAESKVDRGRQLIIKNQINTKEAVLIGDTIHDFEVANDIGVDCILIANGHQSKKRLRNKTMDDVLILDKIEQLIN